MFSKCSILVVVALCAFQGTQANLIDDIISGVNNVMNQTVTSIKERIEEMENNAGSIISSIEERIKEAEASASVAISQAAEKAKQLGANITECVQAADKTVSSVTNATESGVANCWASAKSSVQPDIDMVDSYVSQAQSLGQQAAKNISACSWNLVCIAQVASKTGTQGSALVQKVMSNSSKIASDMSSASNSFMSCAQPLISSAVSSVQSAGQQEAQCIQEKIQAALSQ